LSAALLVPSAGVCSQATAQPLVTADFETGDLGGWSVMRTPDGTTLVQDAMVFAIDGPGPLSRTFAGRLAVGNIATPNIDAGIDLFQTLQRGADKVYEGRFDWAAIRETTTGSNSQGGVFTLIVDGVPGASQAAG